MQNRYLIDTNIIIYSINGGLELPEASYYMSQVSYNEIFSYKKMSEEEALSIKKVLDQIEILDTNNTIAHNTTQIQKKYKLSTADSTICATAHTYSLTLITNDKALHQVTEIETELFYFA
ncbi:MAG TPA: PIN domain-containing protein [Campylobacterales bacterium]|nr:PIN domain-containing protein [Campylobacterales bacterium]